MKTAESYKAPCLVINLIRFILYLCFRKCQCSKYCSPFHILSRINQLSQLPYDPTDTVRRPGSFSTRSWMAGPPKEHSHPSHPLPTFLPGGLALLQAQRQNIASHFLKASAYLHTFYRGWISSRILFVSNTKLNKSSRKQDKWRLLPALCPNNREFKILTGKNPLLASGLNSNPSPSTGGEAKKNEFYFLFTLICVQVTNEKVSKSGLWFQQQNNPMRYFSLGHVNVMVQEGETQPQQ